ncbi:unnamed protein product [Trichobilharzia regenti]|nr:unnamed protein product [Trichobilharzia regenti]
MAFLFAQSYLISLYSTFIPPFLLVLISRTYYSLGKRNDSLVTLGDQRIVLLRMAAEVCVDQRDLLSSYGVSNCLPLITPKRVITPSNKENEPEVVSHAKQIIASYPTDTSDLRGVELCSVSWNPVLLTIGAENSRYMNQHALENAESKFLCFFFHVVWAFGLIVSYCVYVKTYCLLK